MKRTFPAAKLAGIGLGALALATFLSTTAEAGGPRAGAGYSAGAGIIAGFAVGALLGTALATPYAYPYYPPPVAYGPPAYYPPPPPAPYCYQTEERYWVPGWGWQVRPVTACY